MQYQKDVAQEMSKQKNYPYRQAGQFILLCMGESIILTLFLEHLIGLIHWKKKNYQLVGRGWIHKKMECIIM